MKIILQGHTPHVHGPVLTNEMCAVAVARDRTGKVLVFFGTEEDTTMLMCTADDWPIFRNVIDDGIARKRAADS